MVGRISSPRFVGRVAELEALEELVRRAGSGSGGAMLVAGEAGIGKSRLVAELGTRARAAGTSVLVGECVELAEGELAFSPIISALRGVMADAAALEGLGGPLLSALAALWPVAGAVEGVVGGREQLFEGVYRVLARLAERQPVLLIIEDVHWIDQSSRDLLAFLVRNARRDAIVLVVTYRPDELHRGHPLRPFLVELERSGRGQRVELEALTRPEVAEQLQAIAGHVPDGRVTERIFRRSEGNPFYAEELLATAQDSGGQLPASLRDTLLLRVERLSAATREVLQAAAIAGRSVDHRLLAPLVGLDEPMLLGALREATDNHLLVSSGAGMTCAFRHALLREAIYDDALPAERLRLHRAIAETLGTHREYAGPSAAAELAHHWHAAGEARAALTASVPAAEEAERMHAYGEALRHVDRALELWDQVDAPEEGAGLDRVDLLLRGSELAGWAGDAGRAVALAEEARAEADEDAEPLRAAATETAIGRAMHYAGRGADAIEHLAAARRLVPSEPPSLEYAEALVGEGRVLMVNGRSPEARAPLEEALPLVELLGDRKLKARLLSTLTLVYAGDGEFERAIAAGREGLRIAKEIGSAEDIVRGYINGSQAIDDTGLIEEALALGIEGIAAAERLGMGHAAGDQLRMQAGWRLLRMGRLEDADRIIRPALDGATSPFNVAGLENIAGHLAAERGEFDAAEPLLERAWELMQRSGGFQLIGPASAWRVMLHLQRGEPERARERLAEGLSLVQDSEGDLIYNAELFWLAARVAADLAERAHLPGWGDVAAQAADVAAAAIDEFDRIITRARGDGAPPEALAFRALAAAEFARLRCERDPEPWRVAADRFRELSEALRAAYADFRAAEAVALSGGRPSEVAEPLRAALDVARSVGARPFRVEVEALARRAGIALESATGSDAGAAIELGLTDRELEVLRLIAEGRTNRQIGEQLFITTKTASAHVSHILAKLGVTNRAEAGAAAHRLGLTSALHAE
ncbi:MAG TPA: AAA family ATPase [Solirubrobacteraceae bacterium]|nr:AAA family ATPase [Solirubrobacteraceae bacterium]